MPHIENEQGLCADRQCIWNTWKEHTHRNDLSPPLVLPNILHAIGNTPLVKLNRIPQAEGLKCDVYVKCEFFNPGGSIKDRIAFRMVEDAEKQGRLTPGCTIIEPTSGNTGIGLAMACAAKGYKCIIVMPEKMSNEKANTLKVLGATVIRTPTEAAHDSPDGLILVAKRLNEEIPNSVILDQYENPGNPLAHYDGTGEEILRALDGHVDMVVGGAGTGGTITGVSRKLKEACPNCVIVAADPDGSILSVPESLNQSNVSFYEVEGIGYDFIPSVCHRDTVDVWIKTNDKVAFPLARRLISEEGILAGGSSGAALAAALKAARDLKAGQKVVVILPDGIRNYMTKFVTDNWLEARHLKPIVNEHNHWWWEHTVAELSLPEAEAINLDTTCADALDILKKNNLSQIPVNDAQGNLSGFLYASHLTQKLVSHNLQLSEAVEKVLFKQYQSVRSDVILGLVGRILEKDDFIAVLNDNGQCRSIINKLDFLTFVSQKQIDITKNGYTNNHFIKNGNSTK